MKRLLIVFILLLALVPIAVAERPHYIYDNANVVADSWETKINEFGAKVDANTTIEIVCVTIQKLDGMTIDEAREKYYNDVPLDGVKGIGKEGKDNGVLIIIAMDDRAWGIEVGYGLEGTLTDSKSANVGRDVLTPRLKEGNTGEGLYNSMVAISKIVGYNVTVDPVIDPVVVPQDEGFFLYMTSATIFILVGMVIVLTILRLRRNNEYTKMENEYELKYMRKTYDTGYVVYPRVQHVCPHCGKETWCEDRGKKSREILEGAVYYLLLLVAFRCLVCHTTFEEQEGKKYRETVDARKVRLMKEEEERKREEEQRRKEQQEYARRRSRDDYDSSYHSSSSSHSGSSSFGGGHSGGGGSSGHW